MAATATNVAFFGSRRLLPHLSRQTRVLSSPSPSPRSFSTSTPSSKWVTTEFVDEREKIALVKLERKPANALSLEFCEEISEAIRTLEEGGTATAMILSSGLESKIFSAGLDISTELYKPDLDRLPKFWSSFQQLFLDLYGSTKLTTIASLEGAAPAGGCMLALSCDYRIVDAAPGSKATIGLNESHLGIVAPPWMCQQYIDVLGHRNAELALLQGLLFRPHEALQVGLVDELFDPPPKSDQAAGQVGRSPLDLAAIRKAEEFARIPAGARAAVKELTRKPLVDSLVKDREKDVDFFCNFVTSEKVQVAIGRYLEALAARSKK